MLRFRLQVCILTDSETLVTKARAADVRVASMKVGWPWQGTLPALVVF